MSNIRVVERRIPDIKVGPFVCQARRAEDLPRLAEALGRPVEGWTEYQVQRLVALYDRDDLYSRSAWRTEKSFPTREEAEAFAASLQDVWGEVHPTLPPAAAWK